MPLSSVSLDPFMFLCFSAPFSFLLCFDESSAVAALRDISSSVLIDVLIEGSVFNLVLLKSHDVLVQFFLLFGVGCFVVDVRVSQEGGMKLKV